MAFPQTSASLSARLGQRPTAADPSCGGKASPRLALVLWLRWNEASPFRWSGRRGQDSSPGLSSSDLGSAPDSLASTLAAGHSHAPLGTPLTETCPEGPASVSQTVFADSQLLRNASSGPFFSVSELPRGPHLSGWGSTPRSAGLCKLSIPQPELAASFWGCAGAAVGSAGRLRERRRAAAGGATPEGPIPGEADGTGLKTCARGHVPAALPRPQPQPVYPATAETPRGAMF